MGGEMIHHDGGPRLVLAQSGDHDLLQKGLKHGPIGGDSNGHDSNGHDSNQPTERERAAHGETAPMTGGAAAGAPAARRARITPRQLGADAGLVENDQGLGRDALDLLGKACPWQGTGGGAFGNDIGAVLLARPECLFWRRKPRRLRVTQSTGRLTLTPVCAASRAPSSAKVASLSAAPNWRRPSRAAAPRRGSGPGPRGLATRRPSLSTARTQFFTVLSATRKRRASAAALPSPCYCPRHAHAPTAPVRADPPNKDAAWFPPPASRSCS